jgi:hypothetical protein
MKLVKTDEAKPGQHVSRDVVDLRGNLLFKAGTSLTPELLASCKDRNISHLFVDTDSVLTAAPAVDPQLKKDAIAKDVDRMFAGVDSSSLMASLREASKRYLIARLGSK